MADLHLKHAPESPIPRVKPHPQSSKISAPFSYIPSDDGTDENLLILLHGLGDTHLPFARLGRQLKLPQTAVLALRALEQVPFLYEEAYQWYTSFDDLGEILQRPNPTPALEFLTKTIQHLTKDCTWHLNRIHLLGFAQGGSVAVEYGIHVWKQHLQNKQKCPSTSSVDSSNEEARGTADNLAEPQSSLASIVTVGGPLLSYHTPSALCPTPVLAAYRPHPSELSFSDTVLRDFGKAFQRVNPLRFGATQGGMPASKSDWEPIMRFWSEHLSKRRMEGLYEVMTGSSRSG